MSDCISPWRSCHLLACEVIAWRGSWSLFSPLLLVSGGRKGNNVGEKKKKTISTLTACSIHFALRVGGKNSLGELDSRSCLVCWIIAGLFPPAPLLQQVALFQEQCQESVLFSGFESQCVVHPPRERALHWNIFSSIWYPEGFSSSQDILQSLICKCGICDFFSKLSRTWVWMDFEISFLRDQLTFRAKEE